MDNNLLHLAYLHHIGFTHKDLKHLFETWEKYVEFFWKVAKKWVDMPWISPERRGKIIDNIRNLDTESIQRIIDEKQIDIITIQDSRYPLRLKTIKRAPYLLYVRGNLQETPLMLGVVWSRHSTNYGKKVLDHTIPDIIRMGGTIISGWAHGIDAISHEITLAEKGYTISVFWCGIDIYYPARNTQLFDRILAGGGAIVSIFPIGTQPEPFYFPIRNEIVAALSDGIIIPEAGKKSGTLITANLALEHGRDVFAVPWDIFRETSQWTNMLIATGQAKCIQNSIGILEEYFPNMTQNVPSFEEKREFGTPEQKEIYQAIEKWYHTPDSIWQNTELGVDSIMVGLALLEMDGHISLSAWWIYQIA